MKIRGVRVHYYEMQDGIWVLYRRRYAIMPMANNAALEAHAWKDKDPDYRRVRFARADF